MAAGYHPSSPSGPYEPQNTVVVMPKTPPMNRSALWLVFWGVGILMGLAIGSLLDDPAPSSVEAQAGDVVDSAQASGPPPTLEVNVRAVLELPTSTPTVYLMPTTTPAKLTPTINECTSADPGTVCRVPFPPEPTETPYPSCLQMDYLTPGAWCEWPDTTATPAWWAGTS